MIRRIRRTQLPLLPLLPTCMLFATACTKWSTLERAPVEGRLATEESRVLVIRDSGVRVELWGPISVEGDSLIGTEGRERPSRDGEPRERVAVALSDIREIRSREGNTLGTTLLVGAGALGVASIIVVEGFQGER